MHIFLSAQNPFQKIQILFSKSISESSLDGVFAFAAEDFSKLFFYRYKTKDSCFGDSGGPYMFRDLATNKWFLNGIVSYGTNYDMCDKPNILGIYTKVANYIEFLDTYIL